MAISGHMRIGTNLHTVAADTKLLAGITLGAAGRVAKATVYLDGQGAGVGAQVARAALYDSTGALKGTSAQVSVGDSRAPGWTDFVFTGGVALTAGTSFLGLHGGEVSDTIRAYADAAPVVSADTYADGAAALAGGELAAPPGGLSAFLTHSPTFTPSAAANDEYHAALPFWEAQTKLGDEPPVAGIAHSMTCGWHGTRLDPRRGSFALVRREGEFALGDDNDLIGERVRVTYRDRSVNVYVVGDADLDDDISLSRRAFAALGLLSTEFLDVDVEVLSAEEA
jgi:hypothetical protein